jgi:hypothetical protein
VVGFRKWLIILHRYLGIALSVLFVIWFLSGIAMIYAGGMPELTPEMRLERMPALDLARVRLNLSEAAERAGSNGSGGRVLLLTIMDRPAYRFTGSRPVTVFADTGEVLKDVGPAEAISIAGRFMDLLAGSLHDVRVLTEADQWTIAQRRQMPLHKIRVDDPARTEVYVSAQLGEVVLETTRGSRALAWLAAIPHWLYFAPLRTNDALWRQVVLATSGLGSILALIGLVLAVMQFAPTAPFRIKRVGSSIPYAGWMRWHYVSGVLFGVFALTWVFSGMLSMEPWGWAAGGGAGPGMRRALAGGPLEPSLFARIDASAWHQVLSGHPVKEVEFLRIQGDPYYLLRGVEAKPLLLASHPLGIGREPFAIESIVSRVKEGFPGAAIVASDVLSEYDSYYYARGSKPPLPVLRVKFGDPNGTWFYIDPAMSQVTAAFTRRDRLERWVYHGLHSLDFSFWYDNRPLWDIGVITLSLGGTALSVIGVVIGIRRLRRDVKGTARFRGKRVFGYHR